MLKVFYVTDLHGSEICWKKFLNAGAFYSADVVILGGDVTGKAMVPIVRRPNGAWEASLQDHRETLETEAEVVEFEKRVDRKSTRLNSSHVSESRMPSSA